MTRTPQLIGICGFKGAGKSTVVHQAIFDPREMDHALPVFQMSIMQPVRNMLSAMGIQDIDNKAKWDDPQPLLNHKSIRHAVITLGTDWARDYIGPDVWIDIAIRDARATMLQGTTVVIDGIRYWNEYEAVRAEGGIMIAFHRPDLPYAPHIETERHISKIQKQCDRRFENVTGEYNASVHRMRSLLLELTAAVPA